MTDLFLIIAVLAVGIAIYGHYRRKLDDHQVNRVHFENALKYLYHRSERGNSLSMEGLQRGLQLSQRMLLQVVARLKESGLINLQEKEMTLTPEGEKWALQIIRAHRLWERYLADETDLPMDRIHELAEKKEHQLKASDLEALEAHLGYPDLDPHGDPIPASDGAMRKVETISLTNFAENRLAIVQHVEDEPPAIFRKLHRKGVVPGSILRKLSDIETGCRVQIEEEQFDLDYLEAGNVYVSSYTMSTGEENVLPLYELKQGESGEVVRLADACRGLTRRRFMDLGITPGVVVKNVLPNAFGGDPTAYFIRGSKIALRREQARDILVKKLQEESIYGS